MLQTCSCGNSVRIATCVSTWKAGLNYETGAVECISLQVSKRSHAVTGMVSGRPRFFCVLCSKSFAMPISSFVAFNHICSPLIITWFPEILSEETHISICSVFYVVKAVVSVSHGLHVTARSFGSSLLGKCLIGHNEEVSGAVANGVQFLLRRENGLLFLLHVCGSKQGCIFQNVSGHILCCDSKFEILCISFTW